MNENFFRKEFIDSANILGFHVVDIPDEIKSIIPLLPLDIKKRVLSRIKQKPYDLGLCINGKYVACELKIVTDGFTFNINKIEPHQIQNLKSCYEAGGKAFCIVNFRKGLTSEQQVKYNMTERVMNVTYAIPSEVIQLLIKRKKYSMPISLMEEIKTIKKLNYINEVWELNKLLK